MKIKRTVKESYLGIPFKYAGETEVIGRERMERIVTGTRLGYLDEKEIDPATITPENRLGRNRPFGHVVAMRTLTETGKIDTFYADYELLEA